MLIVFALFWCFPIGLFLTWQNPGWSTRTKTLITAGLFAFHLLAVMFESVS